MRWNRIIFTTVIGTVYFQAICVNIYSMRLNTVIKLSLDNFCSLQHATDALVSRAVFGRTSGNFPERHDRKMLIYLSFVQSNFCTVLPPKLGSKSKKQKKKRNGHRNFFKLYYLNAFGDKKKWPGDRGKMLNMSLLVPPLPYPFTMNIVFTIYVHTEIF